MKDGCRRMPRVGAGVGWKRRHLSDGRVGELESSRINRVSSRPRAGGAVQRCWSDGRRGMIERRLYERAGVIARSHMLLPTARRGRPSFGAKHATLFRQEALPALRLLAYSRSHPGFRLPALRLGLFGTTACSFNIPLSAYKESKSGRSRYTALEKPGSAFGWSSTIKVARGH